MLAVVPNFTYNNCVESLNIVAPRRAVFADNNVTLEADDATFANVPIELDNIVNNGEAGLFATCNPNEPVVVIPIVFVIPTDPVTLNKVFVTLTDPVTLNKVFVTLTDPVTLNKVFVTLTDPVIGSDNLTDPVIGSDNLTDPVTLNKVFVTLTDPVMLGKLLTEIALVIPTDPVTVICSGNDIPSIPTDPVIC